MINQSVLGDNLFQKDGYLLVENLADVSNYFAVANKLKELGKGNFDQQVPGSLAFYKEPFFETLLVKLLPKIELITGYKLFKTYSYARYYNPGDELKPHNDRNACEVTVSLALGGDTVQWPLWIEDRHNEKRSFVLKPGDAMVFKGIELKHWREANTAGPSAYLFLHYVNAEGPYACEAGDNRQ